MKEGLLVIMLNMFILFLIGCYANNSEVTITVEKSEVLAEDETLVLSGPQTLLDNVLDYLPDHMKYSVMLEVGALKIVGKSHTVKINRIPQNFMEIKGYVLEGFGDYKLFYKDKEETLLLVMDQATYQTSLEDMGSSPVYYIFDSVKEESLADYYDKNKDSMAEIIRNIYEDYQNSKKIDIVIIPLMSLEKTQFVYLTKIMPYLSRIMIFNISGNPISPEEAGKLAKSFSKLEDLSYINFELCGISWMHLKAIASNLGSMPQLLILEMSFNSLEMLGAKYLNEILLKTPKLVKLNIEEVEFTSECISYLQNLKSLDLETLNLSGNNIGKDGIKELKEQVNANKIKHLHLNNVKLGDDLEELIELIKELKSLEALYLKGNNIGDDGISLLSTVFDELPLLKTLDLSENELSPVSIRILSENLHRLLHLSELNLSGNNFSSIEEILLSRNSYFSIQF